MTALHRAWRFENGLIRFAHVNNGFTIMSWTGLPFGEPFPPAEGDIVLKASVCLAPGLKAGAYPLSIENAEIADDETGRAMPCPATGATLSIENDVADGTSCGYGDPFPPEYPEDLVGSIKIGKVHVKKGETGRVPVLFRTNAPLEGFTLNFEFGSNDIRLTRVIPLQDNWEVFNYQVNGPPPAPPFIFSGSEDYVTVAAVFSQNDPSAFTLGYLYLGENALACEDAADADDDGKVDITDVVLTLNHLFGTGSGRLAPPHPNRGRDSKTDDLTPCGAEDSDGN